MSTLNGTNVAPVSLSAIASNDVQLFLNAQAVLMPTIMDYSRLVKVGDLSVAFPKITGLAVTTVTETGADTADTATYGISTDVLTFDAQAEVKAFIQESGQLFSTVDLEAQFFAYAPGKYAESLEAKIWAALKTGTATGHKIQMQGSGNNSVIVNDVRAASTLLDIAKVPSTDRYLACGPTTKQQLLQLPEIAFANQSGSTDPLVNGNFATLYGFKMIVSNVIGSELGFVAYHRTTLAFAYQRALTAIRFPNPVQGRTFLAVRGSSGAKLLDSGNRAVWCQTGTGA